MDVRTVDAEAIRPLRLRVLRPHQTAADVVWPGDDDPRALHVAAVEASEVVAAATVVPEPHPDDPRPGDWRVRGMATAPERRGQGLGAALLDRCVAHARAAGGARVWCQARVGARSLYDRAGFAAEGGVVELPGIGPHVLMARRLA